MPLTGTDAVLTAAIKAKLLADANVVDNASLDTLCSSIAEAVLAHIVANATVIPTLLVAPPLGGPVTGTGTIT